MTWRAIRGFRIVVADLEAAARFYTAIGFVAMERVAIPADEMALLGLRGSGVRERLRAGPSRLDLDWFEEPGNAYPAGTNAADLVFQHLALVTAEPDAAWHAASATGATAISRSGPVTLPQSAGGVTAIKFRDPEGHPLEWLCFPDRTKAGWPREGRLLGIDHSAISVADTAVSRRFYEGRGLVLRGTSRNHGPTQVALDGLDAVEVDVGPLWPETAPPHLELLCYQQPRGRGGVTLAVNDVAATRIVWAADRAALVRDPDGHLHQLEA